MFKKYIDLNKNEIISSLCDLVTYPSVSIESNVPMQPFGKSAAECLHHFLKLASSLGFTTKNIDGYCGYVEFGEGAEIIGIIGHLDVVPALEEDWNYSPFVPTIDNNRIYGRGTTDDKGPVVASLYAMKAVKDYLTENNIKINKRVRLIVGLNEEVSWKCIDYYKEHEEAPTIGFSPDADFPCIYAEKGILSLAISEKLDNNALIKIESASCGNNALNVVPKYADITLELDKKIQVSAFINLLKDFISSNNYEIDIYKIDNQRIKLTSYGVSSHSAHPELGTNAITKLLVTLDYIYKKYNTSFSIVKDFCKFIGDDFTGKNLSINYTDETGALTLNTSRFYVENNKLFIGMNLRVPVTVSMDTIIDIYNKNFTNYNVTVLGRQEPLYVDKENKLVKTLCEIFNETCSTNYSPVAIGGGTYARAFDNCVSFGMMFPGDEDMCHQADEFVDIDKMLLASNIYAKAIYKLLDF